MLLGTSVSSHSDDELEEESIGHPWITNSFIVWAGGYSPRKSIELSAQIGGTVGPEDVVTIDFNDTLKAKDQESVANLGFYWRFGSKWWFSTEYYRTSLEGKATLDRDIEWNGTVYQAGSSISSGFKNSIYRITLGRDFLDRPNMDFSVGLGIHWIEMGAFLEGNGQLLGDGDMTSDPLSFRRESVSVSAPLPNLTAWYLYAITPKWLFEARADWMAASFKQYSGSIVNANVGIHYSITRHLGVGLSYKNFGINVDIDDDDWHGAAKVRHRGPFVNITGTW